MNFTNILTNIIRLPFKDLLFVWFGMLLIIFFFYHFKKKDTFSKEDLKQHKELLQVYLDQYFITNKPLTFFLCFIYLFGISLIFIILRYMYLGQVTPIEISDSILPYVQSTLKLVITIALYKFLLDSLFHKELQKLFLYLTQFSWYRYFKQIIRYKMGESLFGPLRFLCYRISTFTYKGEEYIVGNLPQFIHVNEFDYFLCTQRIQPLANKAQDLAEQYPIVQKCFAFLAYILRFIHIHISEVNKQLPLILLGVLILYELYNKEFRYIYFASFIVLLIKTKHNLNSFIYSRDSTKDRQLSDYFYNNDIDYKVQRMSFIQQEDKNITVNMSTYQNRALFMFSGDLLDYCEAGFKCFNSIDVFLNQSNRRLVGTYRRYLITLSLILITIYILFYRSYHIEGLTFNDIPVMLLFIPLLVAIYSGYKTYYPLTYEEDLTNVAEWKYSLKQNIIYWISVIVQGYVIWVLLFKSTSILEQQEVIFDFILRISKVYTLEDKIIYLHNLFEFTNEKPFVIIINGNDTCQVTLTDIDRDFLRFYLREQDLSTLINESTTLKDIKEYVNSLYKNYMTLQATIIYWEMLIRECATHGISLTEYFEALERFKRQPIIDAWVSSILQNAFYLYLFYLRHKSSTDTSITVLTSISIKGIIKYTWLIIRRLGGLL